MIQGKVIGAMGLSCAILSLGIAARAERRNPRSFHVDPRRGLDDATGDAASPVRSPASLVGRLQPGDTVVLARGRYDQPVQFTDSGTAESPITIRSDEGHQPIVSRTTWTITDASHIVIQGLTFRNCSPGLVIGPNASDNAVEDCRFENCPPKGHHGYERAIVGQAPGAHRNRIENSVLTRPYEPLNGEGAEGIQVVEGNQHWVFRGNRISGYMYGLDMGYQHGNGVPGYILVEDNEFFDCHEGLHIKISDNIIRGNYIHDLRNVGWMMSATGVFLRSSPRTTVENNRIERAGGAGIRALGHDQLIRNNLIVDTPTGIWLSKHGYGAATNSHWLVHNTIVGAILPLWLSGGSQAYVFNNIFVGAPDGTSTIFAAGYSPTNPLETATTVFPDPKWFEH
ncbi:MAG TPA: right-handed parallel beta-helix repeat-containing protein, partial [Armatimonadota bacterium]|nr:right-handed parallel beta-helix repeat-containing protein [Armatimonadota bacterium]